MSNPTSRSNSPVDKDFKNLLSGDYKNTPMSTPTTPPRSKNTGPKGLTPMKKSFKGLVSEGDKLKDTVSTRTSSIGSSGSSLLGDDTNHLDEFKKSAQEYDKKLKSNENFLKLKEDARRIREEKEARMKKYSDQGKTDEEIAKLEKMRLFAKKIERYGNGKLRTTTKAGRRKKRRTRKNNKRKKTQKKNKRKNKKSKRKTRK